VKSTRHYLLQILTKLFSRLTSPRLDRVRAGLSVNCHVTLSVTINLQRKTHCFAWLTCNPNVILTFLYVICSAHAQQVNGVFHQQNTQQRKVGTITLFLGKV